MNSSDSQMESPKCQWKNGGEVVSSSIRTHLLLHSNYFSQRALNLFCVNPNRMQGRINSEEGDRENFVKDCEQPKDSFDRMIYDFDKCRVSVSL